jgi:hypothetical protein
VAAPLRRWVIYVWPAIALGPVGEALAAPLAMPLESLAIVASRSMAGVAASLSLQAEGTGASGAPAQAAKADASRPAPFSSFTRHGIGMSLFLTMVTVLAALIGVVALARLIAGEDLFASRWLH